MPFLPSFLPSFLPLVPSSCAPCFCDLHCHVLYQSPQGVSLECKSTIEMNPAAASSVHDLVLQKLDIDFPAFEAMIKKYYPLQGGAIKVLACRNLLAAEDVLPALFASRSPDISFHTPSTIPLRTTLCANLKEYASLPFCIARASFV
jgi:hypothetical protein